MFERFTDRARRVVVLAQEEARLLGHNYIGTEHLLLGLVHDGEGVAARILMDLGVSLDRVRDSVERRIGRGGSEPSGHVPFTPRAKSVLELSLREALQLHQNYIGTEHILLGLLRESEGVAALTLAELGLDASTVRDAVLDVLAGTGSSVPPATLAAGPYCPSCKTPLEGHIRWKALPATGEGGEPAHTVRVVHCDACECVLGVLPDSGE